MSLEPRQGNGQTYGPLIKSTVETLPDLVSPEKSEVNNQDID